MTRQEILKSVMAAGYHQDHAGFLELLEDAETIISKERMLAAYQQGKIAREKNGLTCPCEECSTPSRLVEKYLT